MPDTRKDNLDALKRLAARLRTGAGVAAVRAGLAVLERGVRQRCPVGATRELRDSVRTDGPFAGERSVTGAVVIGSDHVLPVEYGTRERPAHPFVRPTADLDGPRAVEAMAQVLKRGNA